MLQGATYKLIIKLYKRIAKRLISVITTCKNKVHDKLIIKLNLYKSRLNNSL